MVYFLLSILFRSNGQTILFDSYRSPISNILDIAYASRWWVV